MITLFPQQAKTQFMRITGSRYDAMRVRLAKKGLEVPFSKQDLRVKLLGCMRGDYCGAIRCCYCLKICVLEEVEFDHMIPLVRGGSPCLDNIGFPCAACNAQKQDMRPDEFATLLDFLEQDLPFARTSILKRLQEHSKLLAGKRKAEMLARGVRPQSVQEKPALIKAMDDNF